jgi:hypothetical protein
MYAAIRQGKAGLVRQRSWRARSKRAPSRSSAMLVFKAKYVTYAPDDTVTAISTFDNHAGAEASNRRKRAWIEQSPVPLLSGAATALAGPVIVHTLA